MKLVIIHDKNLNILYISNDIETNRFCPALAANGLNYGWPLSDEPRHEKTCLWDFQPV